MPTQAAMPRFCVTARTCRPKRVRCRMNQTPADDQDDEADDGDAAPGQHQPVRDSTPPDSQSGFATATFCAPKIERTVWIRPRLMPQVASSVSSGRP